MTVQITLQLPNEIVEFIDKQVRSGAATSAAAVVSSAVERERRRLLAMHDAELLAEVDEAEPDDLAGLSDYAAEFTMNID